MSTELRKTTVNSGKKPVTTNDFIRAETDTYFRGYAEKFDGFGKISHYCNLVPIDSLWKKEKTISRSGTDLHVSARIEECFT